MHTEQRFNHNVKVFILYGILFEMMNIFHQPYAVKFLERIGGTDLHISMLNSFKGLVMVFAVLPGVFLINRYLNKKRITGQFILMSRMFVLALVVVPWMPDGWRPYVFLFLMTVVNIPNAIYTASYQSFTGELFPLRRSEVIARRNKYTIAVITVFTLITGQILANVPQTEAQRLLIYQAFFLIAFILGLVEYKAFNRFDYRPVDHGQPLQFRGSLKRVFSNQPFRNFALASTVFHFGWQMGWPLFSIYMIKNLGADEWWLAIISIASSLAMFVGHKFWPKLIETYGNERISTITTLGMALTPFLYALSPNLVILTVVSTVTGLFTSGTITVLFADLLDVTPDKDRIIYIGYYNTLTNITLTISPFVGHFFLTHFGIRTALFVTSGFRALGGLAFLMRERKKTRTP